MGPYSLPRTRKQKDTAQVSNYSLLLRVQINTTSVEVLQKLKKLELPYDQDIPLLDKYLELHRDICPSLLTYCCSIYYKKKLEPTQMSINRWIMKI